MHSPAFSFLSDFGSAKVENEKSDHESQIKAALAEGFQQGLLEGRAEAQADTALRLAEAEVLFAERVALERQAFRQECADVLATRLDGAVNLIEGIIAGRVAALLQPWLIERLRERAIADLESAIARALVEGAKIHIEAPAEVLAHLQSRLPNESFQIGYSEAASPDIRAHIEDTVIEGNIDAWLAQLGTAAA